MSPLFRAIRFIFVNGLPLHQFLTGIILVPLGSVIFWASLFADPDYRYPYFTAAGVVLAIFGVVLLFKGLIGFVTGRLTARTNAQAPHSGPNQYPQQ